MNGSGQTRNRRPRKLIVDTRAETAASVADSPALSTMAWNHCPRSMEYAHVSNDARSAVALQASQHVFGSTLDRIDVGPKASRRLGAGYEDHRDK
jgi:hypothetical protein